MNFIGVNSWGIGKNIIWFTVGPEMDAKTQRKYAPEKSHRVEACFIQEMMQLSSNKLLFHETLFSLFCLVVWTMEA